MSKKLPSKEEEKKLIKQILEPNQPKLVPLVKDLEIYQLPNKKILTRKQSYDMSEFQLNESSNDSDDDGQEGSKKPVPEWADEWAVKKQMEIQIKAMINPLSVFKSAFVDDIDLAKVFNK